MANIAESAVWVQGVYEIALTDPVIGGTGGIANLAAAALANRTLYLKGQVEALSAALTAAIGNWTLGDIPTRVTSLEGLLAALTARVTALETGQTALQASYNALDMRVTALEARPVITDLASTFIAI
jgi:hypothetical protein